MQRFLNFLKAVLKENKLFVLSLDRPARLVLLLLLGLQAGFYLYYLIDVPLEYDAWYSYRHYSGNSFWITWFYYPSPNNHILYNLIARIFVVTGIDCEVAVRLPGFIASIITVYYFFKVSKHYFKSFISLTLVAFVITLHLFIIYSYEARGYSFVNLFCIWMIYSSIKLSENYTGLKYRLLLIFSMALGLFSVPSFLYVILPICALLFVYVLKQRRKDYFLRFLKDLVIAVLLVFAEYSMVLLYNDPQNLINPNGGSGRFSLSEPGILEKIFQHLQILFIEFFGFDGVILASVLVIISVVYFIRSENARSLYLCFLAALLFFSPLIILFLHRVFPYGRNWLYLILPAALCFGFILHATVALFQKLFHPKSVTKFVYLYYVIIVSVCFFRLAAFSDNHRRMTGWDYQLDFFRKKKLNPVIKDVRKIAKTGTGWEFYAAEVIQNFCTKANRGKEISLSAFDLESDVDICVLSTAELPRFRKKLLDYTFAYENDDIWIYFRKGLEKQ